MGVEANRVRFRLISFGRMSRAPCAYRMIGIRN